MSTEKRKMIFENIEMLKVILSDINQYLPKLNQLKNAYEALEIGEFTDEVFTKIKTNGISKILGQFQTSLETQLDRSGITNKNLRSVALQGSDEPKVAIRKAYEALKNVTVEIKPHLPYRTKTLDLLEISFIDGNFKVGNPDAINDTYCKVYLNDESDREIYATLMETEKALNKIAVMAKKFGVGFGIGGSGLHEFFKEEENGKIELKPYSIQHAKTLLPRMKAHQDSIDQRIKREDERKAKDALANEAKMKAFREDPKNSYYYSKD